MTAPLNNTSIPVNNKHRTEDDAKKVPVNLYANQSHSDSRANLDFLQNQAAASIESIKKKTEKKSLSFIQKVKSFFTKDKTADAAPVREFSKDDLQPVVQQRPSIERPSVQEQFSTENIIKAAKSAKPLDPMISSLFGKGPSANNLTKAIFSVMGRQMDLRKKSTEINQGLIEENGVRQKRLLDTYLKFDERAEARKQASGAFSWISTGAAFLSGIFVVGGAIAAAATGGSALGLLPFVFGVAGGIGAAAGGGAQAASGVFKYQSNQDTGEAITAKNEMGLLTGGTQLKLQDMESDDHSIAAISSDMSQLVSKTPNFFRN